MDTSVVAASETEHERWHSWVVPGTAGFEVFGDHAAGLVPLRQIDATNFQVGARFRFRDQTVEDRVVHHLGKVGAFDDEKQRRQAFHAAAGYRPADGPTDLASIPRLMRWLVNTYGVHTLAAIIHDKLITEKANSGQLRSDVVSDRFFREMLGMCGMPFFLRWIVWTAVAMRTRWAAGTYTRAKMILWGLSSVIGIVGSIWLAASGRWLGALAFGAVWLLAAAALWGRQWGAAVFAAIALPVIVPAAVPVLAATAFFSMLDRIKT
ncbi:MAG: DUF1353 domain-containing protein [Ilumatobacteraceae bacterium]